MKECSSVFLQIEKESSWEKGLWRPVCQEQIESFLWDKQPATRQQYAARQQRATRQQHRCSHKQPEVPRAYIQERQEVQHI